MSVVRFSTFMNNCSSEAVLADGSMVFWTAVDGVIY